MASAVNPDLAKERRTAHFDQKQMTYLLYGGKDFYERRKEIENLALSDKFLQTRPSTANLSREEIFDNAAKYGMHMYQQQRKHGLDTAMEQQFYRSCVMPNDTTPVFVHRTMFIPTIRTQSTDEQLEKWLPMAESLEICGTYAQTELGHGTNVRALETRATYDPHTEEFVINTPTHTAKKWWVGNMGKHTNYVALMAQLYTGGKCYGVHPFIVQTRSLKDHQPLPGISIGDIGNKMGFCAVDNGFLAFDNVRIPRDNMLMRYSEVTRDGRYISKSRRSRELSYSSMTLVRIFVVVSRAYIMAKGCTIAIRYSAVRRQGFDASGTKELQVLDYQTQQYKLFPLLAMTYAFNFAGQYMANYFFRIQQEISQGNLDEMAQLHALSAGMKAFTSSNTSTGLETCRLACGGHGYMMASGLPYLYMSETAACTYEGENTVLYQQTAKFLMKCCSQVQQGEKLPGFLCYLNDHQTGLFTMTDLSIQSLADAYKHRAARMITSAAMSINGLVSSGVKMNEAWNKVSVDLVKAARAHCHAFVVHTFLAGIMDENLASTIKPILVKVYRLYALHGIVDNLGDFIQDGYIGADLQERITDEMLDCLQAIRPNAVSLMDAFEIPDRALDSALGAYDGNVYERLYESAMQSKLNATEVSPVYDKYLKPLYTKAAVSKL